MKKPVRRVKKVICWPHRDELKELVPTGTEQIEQVGRTRQSGPKWTLGVRWNEKEK